ncbi:hypothetical protein [Amycolatopsis cihanbeyliensis]|uniref:Uncharacterized protein n=1 Tax=Amycolatopsis cihanbeyliensis TaxID=1128664 RepID=A0A542DQ11_AMYCI|nr:hypothetical protein [Amycolatopsis cihanbeyliensis]TQJ05146.1 hypothetical protein FB471_4971 [Amycolatopsis cihanbeyliensis]
MFESHAIDAFAPAEDADLMIEEFDRPVGQNLAVAAFCYCSRSRGAVTAGHALVAG